MTNYSIDEIINVMQAKNYKIFDEGAYNLNLVGIRNTDDPNANTFNDLFRPFYKDESNNWQIHYWACTTDAGKTQRLSPMNKQFGTGGLVPNQYLGAFKGGMHAAGTKFEHYALRQAKPLKLFRDNNKDENLDYSYDDIQEGMYGINIHRASAWKDVIEVDDWSAGCQVIQNKANQEKLMELYDIAKKLYGEFVSYTLLESSDF